MERIEGMKHRTACVIIAFTILLSGINCCVVRAEEMENEEVYEVEDFVHLEQVEDRDYSINFEELRGENSTWVFEDEKEYTLKLVEKEFLKEEQISIRWDITVKESGSRLEKGYQISEDMTAISLDGESLEKAGLKNHNLVISAVVCSDGMETEYGCQTEVLVKEKVAEIKTSLKKQQNLGRKWTYPLELKVYVEDSHYPAGKKVSLHVEKVTSSDETIVGVKHNTSTGKWSAEGKRVGKAIVNFYLSDGSNNYVLEKEVEVVCEHDLTYEVVQVQNVLTRAKKWLGYKESDGSHMTIVDVYNAYSPLPLNYTVQKRDAWCATYVSAVAIKLGYTYLIPVECGCGRMIERFEARNNWQEDESCIPEAGWIIFYDWQDTGKGDNKGWSDHVGIVEKVSDGKITVIEGNYDNKVKRRYLEVNGKYIRGYGIPEYGKEVVRATTSKKGTITEGCTRCGEVKTKTIYPATDISLDVNEFIYDGKVKELSVKAKNSKGKIIETGEYFLSGAVSKASVGKYMVKVNLDGKRYKGTKNLSYIIYPKAPEKVNAFLYEGYDDVKVTWDSCEGAEGYTVYYKAGAKESYRELLTTTDNYCIKKNLQDGKKYYFKVVPYLTDNGKKIESVQSKTADIYTLKKIQTPTVSKNTAKSVNIKWKDISGETGYQVSKTLVSVKKKACGNTTKNRMNLQVSRKIKYYYRVRAYKNVNGKMIYGPWSDAVAYKLK